MKLIRQIGKTLAQSVDFLIEKNRQAAHLNRLSAVIDGEQETLDNAYIALGKQYLAILEGKEPQKGQEDGTAAALAETIHAAELRLKKAKARCAYTLRYGVPHPSVRAKEMIDIDDVDENGRKKEPEEQDITIAYADPDADNAIIEAAIKETIQEEADKKAADTAPSSP